MQAYEWSFSEPRGHRWFIWHPLLLLIYILAMREVKENQQMKK